jgi:2-polyprenyl-3-methyl-5-hydroxy-6-metoxy-1,4-benzoquinol methylase
MRGERQTPREISDIIKRCYPLHRGLGGAITRLRPYICPFEELLPWIPSRSSVLDVGCGVGIMSVLAVEVAGARHVLGFDTSGAAIAVARQTSLSREVDTIFQTLDHSQWPEGIFDVVMCVDVLHHVPPTSQRAFVSRLAQSTSPGGCLIFKDISPRPFWKAVANRMHDLIMARQWIHYRHEDEVAGWLQEEGLALETRIRLDRLWYGHYLIVARPLESAQRSASTS